MVVRTAPAPLPSPVASDAGELENEADHQPQYTAQQVAALESGLLYREATIPKMRFAFLCVG